MSMHRVRISGSHFAICEAFLLVCEAKWRFERENAKQKVRQNISKYYRFESNASQIDHKLEILTCCSVTMMTASAPSWIPTIHDHTRNMTSFQYKQILRPPTKHAFPGTFLNISSTSSCLYTVVIWH